MADFRLDIIHKLSISLPVSILSLMQTLNRYRMCKILPVNITGDLGAITLDFSANLAIASSDTAVPQKNPLLLTGFAFIWTLLES